MAVHYVAKIIKWLPILSGFYRAATDLQSDLCNLSTCAIYMNIKQYLGLKEKFVFPLWMNATVTIFQSCQD